MPGAATLSNSLGNATCGDTQGRARLRREADERNTRRRRVHTKLTRGFSRAHCSQKQRKQRRRGPTEEGTKPSGVSSSGTVSGVTDLPQQKRVLKTPRSGREPNARGATAHEPVSRKPPPRAGKSAERPGGARARGQGEWSRPGCEVPSWGDGTFQKEAAVTTAKPCDTLKT